MGDTLYANATPSTVGDLITSTANAGASELYDLHFIKSNPTLAWFEKNGKEIDGGNLVSIDLEFAENPTPAFSAPTSAVNTSTNQILTQAFYERRVQTGSIVITKDDMSANMGKQKLIDLVKTRESNFYKTAAKQKNAAFFESSPAYWAPWSLVEICSTSDPATARGNMGQIDRDTYTWWQSNLTSSVGSFTAVGIGVIETMQTTIAPSKGMEVPQFAVTTPTIFNYLKSNLFNRVQLTNATSAEVGIKSIVIGDTEFTYDNDCPSGYVFYLNKNYIQMRTWKGANKETSPYIQPYNQWNFTRLYIDKYQVVTMNPDRLGAHSGITA